MKVSISDKPIGWQPKTLSITFETEEEFDMLFEMTVFDVSIPELVYPSTTEDQTKLQILLMKIQEAF